MKLNDPIHKLKCIKPKIHLYRDEAILDLFKEIYKIVKIYVSQKETKNNEFLFIPISGMHLGGHTSEHFFLKGAPIGIFNMPEKESRVRAISGILAYSLFNRKVDLSATKVLNDLVVQNSESHIVSFGSIKRSVNTLPAIEKNFEVYENIFSSEQLIDESQWSIIFEKIKNIVNDLDNDENLFEIPELDYLNDNLPFVTLSNNEIQQKLHYVSQNIIELGKKSGLNFNYYFPSLHFAIGEENDHSYGFMVVSTNENLNPIESTNEILQFFERLSLVTFSLVGIIEQHHYGKIEKLKARIQLIDKLPEYLLNLTKELKTNNDRNLIREINNNFPHNPLKKAAAIILRNCKTNFESTENPIEYKNRKGKVSDLLIWNNSEKRLDELEQDLKKQSFCYRYNEFHEEFRKTLSGYEHALRHSYQNFIHSSDKGKFWLDYENSILPFMDLADEEVHYQFGEIGTIFKGLKNALSEKTMRLDENSQIKDLEYYIRLFSEDGYTIPNDNFQPTLKWKISNIDLRHIKATIYANKKDSSFVSEIEPYKFENEKWLVYFYRTNSKKIDEDSKKIIKEKLSSKVYEPEKINTLKAMVCDYYLGELIWVSKENSKIEYLSANSFDSGKLIHNPEQILSQKGISSDGTYYFIYLPKEI
jgi:hypothetical protein